MIFPPNLLQIYEKLSVKISELVAVGSIIFIFLCPFQTRRDLNGYRATVDDLLLSNKAHGNIYRITRTFNVLSPRISYIISDSIYNQLIYIFASQKYAGNILLIALLYENSARRADKYSQYRVLQLIIRFQSN